MQTREHKNMVARAAFPTTTEQIDKAQVKDRTQLSALSHLQDAFATQARTKPRLSVQTLGLSPQFRALSLTSNRNKTDGFSHSARIVAITLLPSVPDAAFERR
jgi:hypothetical protein